MAVWDTHKDNHQTNVSLEPKLLIGVHRVQEIWEDPFILVEGNYAELNIVLPSEKMHVMVMHDYEDYAIFILLNKIQSVCVCVCCEWTRKWLDGF